MTIQAILAGTPTWVWVLLAVLVSRGMKAVRGGTAPLDKLAIVPLVFAGWGVLHLATERAAGLDTALMWAVGAALGIGVGAWLAKRSGMTVDRAHRAVTLPGSVIPLVLILATFASKFWIGFEMATTAHLAVDAGIVMFDGLVSGVVAGIFAGRFLIYWLALRPSASTRLESV